MDRQRVLSPTELADRLGMTDAKWVSRESIKYHQPVLGRDCLKELPLARASIIKPETPKWFSRAFWQGLWGRIKCLFQRYFLKEKI